MSCYTVNIIHEAVIPLTDTTAKPLFSIPTIAIWAEVLQHPSDGGNVLISLGGTPAVNREADMPYLGKHWRYDLSKVNVQAPIAGNRVLVRWASRE